ncbi:MAG: SelL-related redox protein [Bacteroidota bacterium]
MYNAAVNNELLANIVTNTNENLYDLSHKKPILLVFLRHLGCVFCKEALSEISQKRESIEKKGVQIVFVHMAANDTAEEYFGRFNLLKLPHISDPVGKIYKAFGITKGTPSQLYGLRTWFNGFNATVVKGHRPEYDPARLGDATQMPGLFLLSQGDIKQKYLHRYASEKPNYDQFIKCALAS